MFVELSSIINVVAIRRNDGFHVATEGLASTADVVLCHGVPVLADSSFEGLSVWMTNTAGLPLDIHTIGVGIKDVGGQMGLKRVQKYSKYLFKRVLQRRGWVFFIAGLKVDSPPSLGLSIHFFDSSLDTLV
uniref:Uncharacterized protein n=1 Tax=Lepeophtheirus salmonis TaxID=72036 RepID=A0A0K2VJZ8_LEPSM